MPANKAKVAIKMESKKAYGPGGIVMVNKLYKNIIKTALNTDYGLTGMKMVKKKSSEILKMEKEKV